MRLTPPQQAVEEEREAAWLRALEAGDTTILDLIRVTGLGRSQIYERLKRARMNRHAEEHESDGTLNIDLPWVELVDSIRPPTPHYDLATDRLEKPAGAFRIADGKGRLRVKSAGEVKPSTDEPEEARTPEKPRKFRPHARVRKGKPLTPEEVERIKARASRRKKRPAPAA